MSIEAKPLSSPSPNKKRPAKPEVVVEPIDVYAWWNRTVWQYSYVEPCPRCGSTHIHGGGNGDQPDLAIGETGSWGSHCLNDTVQVEFRLVHIVPRPVRPGDTDYKSALEKGLALAREWRERTFIPCYICPPHPSGELTKHKSPNFHQRLTYPCDICAPVRPGVPRRHQRSNKTPRHIGASN
jgi:hypothetical protein